MRSKKIAVFYNKKQVCFDGIKDKSFSQSPIKPYLLMEKLKTLPMASAFEMVDNFEPFKKEDFMIAHTEKYIDNVFMGVGNCSSNSLPWSKNLVESLTYTSSSLYNAIKHSIEVPRQVSLSPTSGFHHAQPDSGSGFCTFSGQVIASTKLYRELGLTGCYFDLDGHFGNSIEDSRGFVPDLAFAIPKQCNINPVGRDASYVKSLRSHLQEMEVLIRAGKVHYIVWCHGADSHACDDLGSQCNTENWLMCATIFYSWLRDLEADLGRCIPLTLSLFGGYRKDDYESVLNLHLKDFMQCTSILLNESFEDNLKVVEWAIPGR